MGTENDLDVEGQTEPPICGLKSSVACTPSPTLAETAGPDATTEDRGSITSTVDTAVTVPVFTPESGHTFSVPDVCAFLETNAESVMLLFFFSLSSLSLTQTPSHGIDAPEAASRLQRHGPNKVEGAKGLSVWTILLRQVSNSLTIVSVAVFAHPHLPCNLQDAIPDPLLTRSSLSRWSSPLPSTITSKAA